MQSKERNSNIDFFKFLYSLVIVSFHFKSPNGTHFIGGNTAVEFFLIVSGFLLFEAWERSEKNLTPQQYFVKRFKRFFPYAFTGAVFAFIVLRGFRGQIHSVADVAEHFSSDIWEIFLIKMNGMNNNASMLNSPAWTISAMLIVGFFFWCLLYFRESEFLNAVLPASLLLILGAIPHIENKHYGAWMGLTNFGILRTWLVMGAAYYSLQFCKILRQRLNKKGRICMTVLEVACHVFALVVMFKSTSYEYRHCVTLAFMVSTAIAFSGQSYLTTLANKLNIYIYIFRKRLFDFLGEFNMSIYLTHYTVIKYLMYYYGTPGYFYHKKLFVLISLMSAVLHYVFTKKLLKTSRHIYGKILQGITRE